MRQNYQKYNKINTERYKKGIKNSFWSLISVSIGLIFTYLAMTSPARNTSLDKENIKIEEDNDFSYISVGNLNTPETLKPLKKDNEKIKNSKNRIKIDNR